MVWDSPDNAAHGLPTLHGLVVLSDPRTGVPLAVMDAAERDEFLNNAARWEAMTAEERSLWRALVQRFPLMPPAPPGYHIVQYPPSPPGVILPPSPPGMNRLVLSATTNKAGKAGRNSKNAGLTGWWSWVSAGRHRQERHGVVAEDVNHLHRDDVPPGLGVGMGG